MSRRLELYVDDQRVELSAEPQVALSYDAAATRSIAAARQAQIVEFEVEMSHSASVVFGGEGYPHAATRFNAESHVGALKLEGVTLVEGEVTLRSIERTGLSLKYGLRITRSAAPWADIAVDTLLSETAIDYQITLRTADVTATWEEEQPVQFFPVERDEYEVVISSVALELVRRVRSIDEYHPFLKLDSVVRSLVEVSGYELVSELAESEEFKQLYMSGSYVSQDNDAAEEAMDFYVKKSSSESAVGDYTGRVTFSESQTGSSAVDTFVDIGTIDSDAECYTRGSCLQYVSGAVQFTPPTSVSVGFEYRVLYTTEYWIESRERLMAFDTFYFGESPAIKVDILNIFPDERGEAKLTGFNYLLVVFDHVDGASYRVRARLDGSSAYTTLTSWSGRSTNFTTPFVDSVDEIVLDVLSGGSYVEFAQDWALYQGYIEEWGETEVDVTLRTSPNTISKKRFIGMYVEGAQQGMAFTLLEGTSIRPYFAAYPGYGDVVEYVDLSQHEIHQDDVLESLQHLFNLRFYTDNVAQRLYIDPLERIYDRSVVWDWSDRIVESEGIIYEDAAIDVARRRKWGFQDGDGAVSRSSPEYGEWSVALGSYASNDSSVSILNPIFSPSLNNDDGVLIVGNRDDLSIVDTLEFSPRVVYYRGLDEAGDPIVAFHSAEQGVTLCFDDYEGVAGLNQHYAAQIEREERSQYVTLTLRLEPHEMVDLLSPLEGRASVLSTFSLRIDGEWIECWIEQIANYRVGEGSAQIKFLII
ncbi:MAG: hypothetical protein R3Y68_00080 [Rikenellaceae bacterium]